MTNESISRTTFDEDEADALRAIGWHPAAAGSRCPDSALLLAAEEGVLDDAVVTHVRAHVGSCPTCRQLAADMAVLFDEHPDAAQVARVDALVDGQRPARRPPYWWLGAAGAALAATLIWMLVAPRPSPPLLPESELARATPPPAPSIFVVDRPAAPPGDVDLTVRGEASTGVSLETQLATALDLADAGNTAGALSRLDAVVRAHPDSPHAWLALGAVRLRADRNAEALTALERARGLKGDPATVNEVDWFLGIALVRTGQRGRARPLLDGLCKRGGARSAQACAGVAQIDRTGPAR